MRASLVLLSAILLAGLSSACAPYTVGEEFGVFSFVDHMRRDPMRWEGGNTYLAYRELCNRATKRCWISDPDSRRTSFELVSKDANRVAIVSNDYSPGLPAGLRIEVFDAATGESQSCTNCDSDFIEVDRKVNAYVRGSYFVFDEEKAEGGRRAAFVLEFRNGTYLRTNLFDIPTRKGVRYVSIPSVDRNGDRVAWVLCRDLCEINVVRMGSKTEVEILPTDCKYEAGDFLTIDWSGGHVSTSCTSAWSE